MMAQEDELEDECWVTVVVFNRHQKKCLLVRDEQEKCEWWLPHEKLAVDSASFVKTAGALLQVRFTQSQSMHFVYGKIRLMFSSSLAVKQMCTYSIPL